MIDALILTVLGMGTVILVLMLISAIISCFTIIFPQEKTATVSNIQPIASVVTPMASNDEVIAAIMAAVTICMGSSDFRITSVSPIVVRPYVHSNSAWSAVGIVENNHR